VKFPHVVGCLHPTHAKSLDFRLYAWKPFNDRTIQIRVYIIGHVLLEYERIRVYLFIISECHVFMKAPASDRGGTVRRPLYFCRRHVPNGMSRCCPVDKLAAAAPPRMLTNGNEASSVRRWLRWPPTCAWPSTPRHPPASAPTPYAPHPPRHPRFLRPTPAPCLQLPQHVPTGRCALSLLRTPAVGEWLRGRDIAGHLCLW